MKKFLDLFKNLGVQLILYNVAISFVVLGMGAYFSYNKVIDILESNNEKYLVQQFSQAEYNVASIIHETERISKSLLVDPSIQQFLVDNYFGKDAFMYYQTKKGVLDKITETVNNYYFLHSIYIYTQNRGGIGGSDSFTFVLDGQGEAGEFPEQLYNRTEDAFPRTQLRGGIRSSFFTHYQADDSRDLIAVSSALQPIYESGRNAILVVNIDEEYIASTYANAESLKEGHIYIVDGEGVIVSCNDKDKNGLHYRGFGMIDKEMSQGSFTPHGTSLQGVYYKLKEYDWYLVSEFDRDFYLRDIISMKRILFGVFIISFLAITFFSLLWIRSVTRPLYHLAGKMQDLGKGNIGLTISKVPQNEFGIVIKRFNEMSLSINNLININNEINEQKRELEIETLQSQINPHFLYNTLNMIKWMAVDLKAKSIVNIIVVLGNILRPIFRTLDSMWTIGDEISYVENYIKIINMRFDNSIHINVNIDKDYLDCKIPRFIIQPIIENAIIHNSTDGQKPLDINMHIEEMDPGLHIKISDTGAGIEESRLREINENLHKVSHTGQPDLNGHIGLTNVNRRLQLSFSEECYLTLENNPSQGLTVTMMIQKDV